MGCITRRGFVGLGAAAVAAALSGATACSPRSSAVPSPSASEAPSEGALGGAVASGPGAPLVTGGQSGVYWQAGRQLARDSAGSPSLDALVSDGAVSNIAALADGSAVFAYCQADVAAWAHDGTGPFEGAPVRIAEAAALYDEFVQLVTRDSNVKAPADLAGKRVSLGAPGSGTYYNALDVLGACGLSEEDVTPTYQGFGDSAKSLSEGLIDAAFMVAGVPTPALARLFESESDVRLVPIAKELSDALLAASPHYAPATVEAGAYPGSGKAVSTVSVRAVLLASGDAPEESVRALKAALAS